MYQMTWTQKPIDKDGQTIEPLFEGSIELKAPKYLERLQYFKDLALLENKILDTQDVRVNADRLEKMIEIAKRHIISIKLTRKSDGIEFTTIDDLEYDSDGGDILIQVCSYLLEGARLGKNLVRKLEGTPSN